MKFFELVFNAVLPKSTITRIIDFGSLDINGGPHLLLEPFNCEYIGVDLDEGANVSLVSRGELVDLPTESFDIAMSSELFEHAPTWREIFFNMCRLTKSGGIVVLSCAGRFRREHGTTRSDNGFSAPFVVRQGVEYYGNVSAGDIRRAISLDSWFDRYGLYENYWSHDTYFVGIRKGGTDQALENFELLINQLENHYSRSSFVSQILILKSLLFRRFPILVRIRDRLR
jgi:SAM-dependent methyltransferase